MKDYAAIGQQIPLNGAITLQPLTDIQLQEYLVDHPEIYNAIQADEQLRELARTPLLLSLITFAWDKLDASLRNKGDLQSGDVRDAIFKAYCRQRYQYEARKRNADLPFTYDEMMEILGELAMWNANDWRPGKAWRDDERRPEENVLIPYDFAYVIKNKDLIKNFKQMIVHLNILSPTNETDYRFVHLLLRDFLAYDFSTSNLSSFYGGRRNCVNTIINLSDKRAAKPLIAYLKDTDSDMRQHTSTALKKLGWHPTNEEQEIQYLIASQDWDNLILKGDIAVAILIIYLDDKNSTVRRYIADILGKIGDTRAVKPLISHLDDKNSTVRRYIADALGKIGDTRAVEPLISCLNDNDCNVRSSTGEALDKIGWQPQNEDHEIQYLIASQNWDELIKKERRAIEPLITCLSDVNWSIRSNAANALTRVGIIALDPLIACLDSDNSLLKVSSSIVLGNIGNRRAVNPLTACLRDEDKDVQKHAALALGKIGDNRSIEPLIARLGDSNWFVRRFAAEALGQIGDDRATKPLITCLNDNDNAVRWWAKEALRMIGMSPKQKIHYFYARFRWMLQATLRGTNKNKP